MIEIKVPEMGESISEATIASWLKVSDQAVEAEEAIAELETDKATIEVYAPVAGFLGQIIKKVGETVSVGEVIAVLSPSSDSAGVPDPLPAAKRLIAESGLSQQDISGLRGSGKRQQIIKEDVLQHLESIPVADLPIQNDSKKMGQDIPAKSARQPMAKQAIHAKERLQPMSRLRQTIAARLVQAQQSAAILTTFNEIDMQQTMALRQTYKDRFKEEYEVGLGFMSFFVKAVVLALQTFPAINAEVRDNNIVYKDYYDIGIAVGGPKGLVVPVIRDVDNLSFAEIEAQIVDLAKQVKDGSIGLAQLQGGTFSITNGGIYGSMLSTPILNPPQSGILGMHNIVNRPVVVANQIVIRPIMYVALSYDHRIVDGKEAVSFLVKIKQAIEDPARMLLGV